MTLVGHQEKRCLLWVRLEFGSWVMFGSLSAGSPCWRSRRGVLGTTPATQQAQEVMVPCWSTCQSKHKTYTSCLQRDTNSLACPWNLWLTSTSSDGCSYNRRSGQAADETEGGGHCQQLIALKLNFESWGARYLPPVGFYWGQTTLHTNLWLLFVDCGHDHDHCRSGAFEPMAASFLSKP